MKQVEVEAVIVISSRETWLGHNHDNHDNHDDIKRNTGLES